MWNWVTSRTTAHSSSLLLPFRISNSSGDSARRSSSPCCSAVRTEKIGLEVIFDLGSMDSFVDSILFSKFHCHVMPSFSIFPCTHLSEYSSLRWGGIWMIEQPSLSAYDSSAIDSTRSTLWSRDRWTPAICWLIGGFVVPGSGSILFCRLFRLVESFKCCAKLQMNNAWVLGIHFEYFLN